MSKGNPAIKVRVDADTLANLQMLAEGAGISLSALVRVIIDRYLDEMTT